MATLTGLSFAGMSAPVNAEETTTPVVLGSQEATDLLLNKKVDEPTLDYLKSNNILIPQKKYDEATKTWVDGGEPIEALDSAYSITKLTDEEAAAYEAAEEADRDKMVFKYTTTDEEGNLTDTYYKAVLSSPLVGEETVEGDFNLSLGTSKNIIWTELTEKPAEGTANTITIKLPNNVEKYYGYEYKMPEGYSEQHEQKWQDGGDYSTNSLDKLLFKDIRHDNEGGALWFNHVNSIGTINADFYGNNAQDGGRDHASGGALWSYDSVIGDINGDFINNYIISNAGDAKGGAIYNSEATVGNLKGDYVGNYVKATAEGKNAEGGAIWNHSSSIEDIKGSFIGNYAVSDKGDAKGGAVFNYGVKDTDHIGNITGDFINNSVTSGGEFADGGAIYNHSVKIGNITGDFINNNTHNSKYVHGGAIHNDHGEIGKITGSFINNYVSGLNYAHGGAISNDGKITSIDGNFINNRVSAVNGTAWAGAIFNCENAIIGDIKGDFISNSAYSTNDAAYDGAIANRGSIGNINGNFINNSVSAKTYVHGGAVFNYGSAGIKNINGSFISNSTVATSGQAWGGALSNEGTIDNINGDFVNNSVKSENDAAYDGAISNWRTIANITGNFVGNKVIGSTYAQGGAISNHTGSGYGNVTIGNVTGDFINNSATAISGTANGGAIYNHSAKIGNITGDFINNSAISTNYSAYGGAIYNNSYSSIANITGDFINNSAANYGGAIYNNYSSSITNITGDFIGNDVVSEKGSADGGAIYNDRGTIGGITGDFINNKAESSITMTNLGRLSYYGYGGAIANYIKENSSATVKVGDINGDFIGNTLISTLTVKSGSGFNGLYGGAIANYAQKTRSGSPKAEIGDITGNFISNSVIFNAVVAETKPGSSQNAASGYACGGAIANMSYNGEASIGNITGNFINNSAISSDNAYGGAIYNISSGAKIGNITGDFINNFAIAKVGKAYGGAIYNSGYSVIGAIDEDGNLVGGLINSNIVGNHAVSEEGTAQGGAIWTDSNMNLIADGKTIEISGNYTESAGVRDDNAIYIGSADATFTFKLKNNASILMKDNIRGVVKTETETQEDGTEIEKITDAYKVNIIGDSTDTTFYMLNDMYNANVTLGNTTVNTINNQTHAYAFNSLTLTGDMNFAADVDLKNQAMDRFTANEYGEHTGNLNVVGMNLLSDTPEDRPITEIYFAQEGLKDHVTVNGNAANKLDLPHTVQTTAYTPIFKYNVAYDNRKDAGYFVFGKGDRILVPVDPNKPDSGITDGGSTGNDSDAFNPAVLASPVATQLGAYSAINNSLEHVFEHVDTFSLLPNAARTAMQENNKYAISNGGAYATSDFNQKSAWVKPYAMFESVGLKNGPKTDVFSYGTIVGGDGEITAMENGWSRVGTLYAGYNGSSQSYSSVDTYQNGGIIGGTETYYKGNFWTALTATAGASVGEASTMYGHETFTSLMAGIANKTGYNLEFKEGRFIIQPTLLTSYTFVNTFDYTNAAGVKIDSDPLHVLQLHPHVKFIANTKNGWQPYARVGMVWNIMDETKFTANDVRLPKMSIKPYVEYGVGIQKRWSDKFTAWGQAMIRNGGRNGVALSAGFRWSLGKGGNDTKNVNNPADKVVLKQLNGTASVAGEKTVLKQIKRPTTISLSSMKVTR